MTEFTLYSLLMNVLYAALAVLAVLGVLRLFDRMLGIHFKDTWNEIKDDNNVAMALYLGLRFLAVCVLLGSIIS